MPCPRHPRLAVRGEPASACGVRDLSLDRLALGAELTCLWSGLATPLPVVETSWRPSRPCSGGEQLCGRHAAL